MDQRDVTGIVHRALLQAHGDLNGKDYKRIIGVAIDQGSDHKDAEIALITDDGGRKQEWVIKPKDFTEAERQ